MQSSALPKRPLIYSMRSLALLFLILLLPGAIRASIVRQVTMKEMVETCQLVFEGEVVAVEPRWENNGNNIATYIQFKISEVIKGNYSQRWLELSFLGGTIGNVTQAVSDLHIPEMGEKGIYFVRSTQERMVNPLCGWDQGHFLIVAGPGGRQIVTTRSGRQVSDVGPGPITKSGDFSTGTALGIRAWITPAND